MIVSRLQKNLPYYEDPGHHRHPDRIGIAAGGGLASDPVLAGLDFPYWLGTWFGIYGTWEGLGFQFAAMVFVMGSCSLAEAMRKHKLSSLSRDAVKSSTETRAALKSVEF